jgi:hypothetical protein
VNAVIVVVAAVVVAAAAAAESATTPTGKCQHLVQGLIGPVLYH